MTYGDQESENWHEETAKEFAAQRDALSRRIDEIERKHEERYAKVLSDVTAAQAKLASVKARVEKLRTDLGPLFYLCQWGHAVAGTALQLKPEVAAAEQALLSFLHEPLVTPPAEATEKPKGRLVRAAHEPINNGSGYCDVCLVYIPQHGTGESWAY